MNTKYKSFGSLQTVPVKGFFSERSVRFVFSACLRNEVALPPKSGSRILAKRDYCLDLVVTNIGQVESSQDGAVLNRKECYTVSETRNNPLHTNCAGEVAGETN